MEPALPPLPADRSVTPTSSLGARLLNVYATPGEVFEEVRQSPPSAANWLVPVLLSCLISVISAVAIFSQETVVRQIQEQAFCWLFGPWAVVRFGWIVLGWGALGA